MGREKPRNAVSHMHCIQMPEFVKPVEREQGNSETHEPRAASSSRTLLFGHDDGDVTVPAQDIHADIVAVPDEEQIHAGPCDL
jgi:hypothetical protein